MKSLIKKLFNSETFVLLRNSLDIRSQIYNKNLPGFSSVSDAFPWRTDNSFKTIFKFSDILNIFYDISDSEVEIRFYSNKGKYIKNINLNNLKLSNEIIIDKELLDGIEDYGVFHIFHKSENEILNKEVISNRCYLGYSYKNNLYSFVHGNVFVSYLNKNKIIDGKIIKRSLFKNQIYRIQKYFDDLDKIELFVTNPTFKKIYFTVNNKNFELNKGCSTIINIDCASDKIVILKSNCTYLRPTLFNYKNCYLDVHHS